VRGIDLHLQVEVTYAETLDYLFSQLPMYQRQGKAAYKADLSNTIALCKRLGNPEQDFPTIHVAGTNGKGSTCSIVASILQEAGYKVGLFTSPHLKDFRERIRINGKMIPEQAVVSFVEGQQELLADLSPSFFEWTAALCFHHFATQQVDIAVIEVGLGGRLDSTNVVRSILTCVTSISLDHTNLLGDTVEQIAGEKAGIIKTKVPVILPDAMSTALQSVFQEKAMAENAPVILACPFRHPTLNGDHQFSNAGCALEMIRVLNQQGYAISDEQIALGFERIRQNTGLRGRWEVLSTSPRVIADVAHNQQGVEAMLRLLAKETYDQLHIVYGTVNDKDLHTILPLFPQKAHYYFAKANVPRALDAPILQQQAGELGLQGQAFENVRQALDTALATISGDDLVLVTGSVFTVAEVL